MAKTIFEEMGGKYERQGDYLIPCLTVPAEEEQPIGIWGQRHLDYLKHHCKVTYTNLLTSGRLNAYLADINRQAQERFERLIEDVYKRQDTSLVDYNRSGVPLVEIVSEPDMRSAEEVIAYLEKLRMICLLYTSRCV